MTDVVTSRKSRPDRRQRSIYQVHYSLARCQDMARPLPAPNQNQITAYSRQVAGHMTTSGEKYLGVLQCSDGTILKPIIKESQKREVDFYSRLSTATHRDLVELRSFTPAYYGCRKFTYNGHEMEYIVLEDLVVRMLEPCIMDVKIGKRTYDPLASPDKIARESTKYRVCKQQYGFCIPGYQVWELPAGRLVRHGKEHGKRLEGDAVVAAIRTFLNGSGGYVCRALLLWMLSQLWRLQRWAARQAALRLYGGSLLVAYDSRPLSECCKGKGQDHGRKTSTAGQRPPPRISTTIGPAPPASKRLPRPSPGRRSTEWEACLHYVFRCVVATRELYCPNGHLFYELCYDLRSSKCRRVASVRRRSIHSLHTPITGSNFSGQLSAKGPVYKAVGSVPITDMALAHTTFGPQPKSPWDEIVDQLSHNHSLDHNYEEELSKIKMNYRALLDKLSEDTPSPNQWGTVKLIDFAHAFFNEEHEMAVDNNFREGIDNFVAIFEQFLKENDEVM